MKLYVLQTVAMYHSTLEVYGGSSVHKTMADALASLLEQILADMAECADDPETRIPRSRQELIESIGSDGRMFHISVGDASFHYWITAHDLDWAHECAAEGAI